MKKYLVIGNPINHSLSPKLHNYWLKKNKIDAHYEKKKLDNKDLKNLIENLKEAKIDGINVTVPFKKEIINHLDKLSFEAERTQSVNTIYLKNDIVFGHNTDIEGFEKSIKNINFNPINKKVLILGAGGVVPSIIFALKKMNSSEIIISNRTKNKAEDLKKLFPDLKIINWGDSSDFDIIINATSVGLQNTDQIKLNYINDKKNKFFYDVIYNPKETNFLKNAKKLGNSTTNGKMMFIYQAAAAFKIWHGVDSEIDEGTMKLLDD